MSRGYLLEGAADAPQAVSGDGTGEDDAVGEDAEHYGPVHVGERGGQGYRVAGGGDGLKAEELKERPEKDVDRRRKDVGAEEAAAPGAVRLCHAVEGAHRLLEQELELAGHIFEPRYGKDAYQQRRREQHHRHNEGGNIARIHRADAEQVDLVGLVQDGVPHRLLNGLRLPAAGDDEARRQQYHADTEPGD